MSSDFTRIGWLSGEDYPKGSVPDDILQKLSLFISLFLNATRGFHSCTLCQGAPRRSKARVGKNIYELGSAEFLFQGTSGEVYSSPNLLYHYIKDHQFLPPESWMEAVKSSPLPDTDEYWSFLEEAGAHIGMDWLKTRAMKSLFQAKVWLNCQSGILADWEGHETGKPLLISTPHNTDLEETSQRVSLIQADNFWSIVGIDEIGQHYLDKAEHLADAVALSQHIVRAKAEDSTWEEALHKSLIHVSMRMGTYEPKTRIKL